MPVTRTLVVKACLSLAVLLMAIAATFASANPKIASPPRRRPGNRPGPVRQAKCTKAKIHPKARHATRKLACIDRTKNPGSTPDPVQSQSEVTLPSAAGTPSVEQGSAPSSSVEQGSGPSSEPEAEHNAPLRLFSASSFWNSPIDGNVPLDANSEKFVEAFDAEVMQEQQARNGPWINTTSYSVPIYTVPADQPTMQVQLVSQFAAPALRSAWSAVPMPPDATPASGTDGHLVVWQPSTDRLWEFWRLTHAASGWQASWGGAMQHVSSNSGAYGPEAWAGAQPFWGASASSLSIAGGVITLEDLKYGAINHALAISLPEVRKGVYASPAKRSDGTSSNPLSLPEGAHLRLDPALNLATLHLPPLTLMLAQAAQTYGIFVRDKSSAITFNAQVPTTGSNPYTGSLGYFEGKTPAQLLASFPWSHLQVLKAELHSLTTPIQ